ncbi:MAG: tRNA pseudouridine(38-40) synthase TruA [Thermoanaerobaculia bacterium]
MPNYRLLIEYEGTRYSGWQSQQNTSKTVQGALGRAAEQIFGNGRLIGAGRTDAGVHAAAQVANLTVAKSMPPLEIARKMNDLLPHDITILSVDPAPSGFHARHDATGRVYLYQISRRRTAFAKPFVWWIKDRLDTDAMLEAADVLRGFHDFAPFTDKRLVKESTAVAVEDLQIAESGDLVLFRIRASHFLWKMVRKIVFTVAEAGRGNIPPAAVGEILDGKREPFTHSAPSSGLFLEAVLYPGDTFDRPLEPLVPVATFRRRSG